MNIHRNQMLRRLLLPIFRKINLGDIKVKHAHTGKKILLHSYNHKGYWYKGRERERESMALYAELISSGDTVVEVGGHIGFVSLYYSKLVGDNGFVYVFEPGDNNLKYIRENTKEEKNISLIEKAANDYTGTVDFYIENLTGQNNSILKDFSVLEKNIASQRVSNIQRTRKTVNCVSLDDFVQEKGIAPDFIKIDVEGAELNVLKGMAKILTDNFILMVEVTENKESVYNLLDSHNYVLFKPSKHKIESYKELSSDIFAIKKNHSLYKKVFDK